METEKDEAEDKIKISDLEFPKNNEIGHGAFGKVLLAVVKKTGEKVAIKKVFQDRRYKNRELPIMLELHHPNIVELKSYYKTKAENKSDDEFFLNCIMEYVPMTLSNLISKNTISFYIIKIIFISDVKMHRVSPFFGYMSSRYQAPKYINRSKRLDFEIMRFRLCKTFSQNRVEYFLHM